MRSPWSLRGRADNAEAMKLVKEQAQAGCGVVGMTLELSLLAIKAAQREAAEEGLAILRQPMFATGKML